MHLIIAEKNISAQRIAGILAGAGKVAVSRDGGIATYHFDDCAVIGLRGHVVEVDFEPGYTNWRSTEKTPRSLIDARTIKIPTEKKIVALVQKLARKADRVTIATDFDTEGELIGKEAYELVRQVNRDVNVDRARFSAITPEEIRHAFSSTTGIDFALAAAGEARQVIDLMWGASLTRFISLAAKRGTKNILSVGRVQSPTLTMIVDREREIEEFVPERYWQLSVSTGKKGQEFEARHTTARFTDQTTAELARDRTQPPLTVTDVKEGTRMDRAPPPFDTTGLIVAAARLGFSAANSMRVAEDLYMNGFISYPRTDNTIYPKTLDLAGILRTIHPTEFSQDVDWVIANRRAVPTRGKKSSTDHPPIHPTGAASREALGKDQWKIYELVVRRFLATLSPDAKWLTSKVNLEAGSEPYTATGGRLVEPGWRTVYPYSEAKDIILPDVTTGEVLPIHEVLLEEKETQPPPRYSQSKLIQQMEELGLGTKSTRHEVIGKLISRKYVEGNPLRPTLVGRAVIESLENHADTITKPDMTQTLEQHMQQIKEEKRTGNDVVTESRSMLHRVFDQLEQHENEIGAEIMEQTAEELTIGPCPACGGDLRIRHMRNQSQFIGCSRYPECSFNIGLPMAIWGFALRTDDVCNTHHLHHVRLVRKGSRPWEIGCPLCHHITSHRETLDLMPSMTDEIHAGLNRHHMYTVYEVAKSDPEVISGAIGRPVEEARRFIGEAAEVLIRLRKRSDCRKFVRSHITPRRGRSPGALVRKLHQAGIEDITGLGGARPEVLREAGLGEDEATTLQREARKLVYERELREMGIPAASLKRYQDAGIESPEQFCRMHPYELAGKTGISLDTVYRHVGSICTKLNRPVPERYTKGRIEKGEKELSARGGVDRAALHLLRQAGVVDAKSLLSADPGKLSEATGIPLARINGYRKRFEKEIIVI
ncbi:MAG: DNA topoisomerase I [Methanoregulaceae archaeon]|nr:DNA topoisomerase I [Methanoregulaceae archaeon]